MLPALRANRPSGILDMIQMIQTMGTAGNGVMVVQVV